MTTVWKNSLHDHVDEQMTEPGFGPVIGDVLKKIRSGWFPKWEIDCVLQKHVPWYDLYDAYAFAQIHTMMWSGEVVVVKVAMGDEPFPDACIKQNDAVMKKMVRPFVGNFYGGLRDQDGWVEWTEPVFGTEFFVDDEDVEHKRLVEIPVGGVPLEVGSTYAARTLGHIYSDPGVARWPYGSKDMWIMVKTKSRSLPSASNQAVLELVDAKRMSK